MLTVNTKETKKVSYYSMREFFSIIYNLTKNETVQEMKKFNQHANISCYKHCMQVAYYTYIVCKKLHLDYVSATRAALLHDYFTESDFNGVTGIKKGVVHPMIAYNNACKDFYVNELEKNVIVSHMFPLGKVIPKYKESWVVTLVDKGVATYELSKYKFKNAITIYMLFIMNMILFGQK